jgi:dipeptidyl-peptidase-4
VRVIDAAGQVIAAPDGPAVTFGRPEHVAAESMGRYRGYWWSPDGRHMLIARVDEAAVRQWYRADPAEPGQPPTAFRYPPAGSANAAVSLWIADVVGPAGARSPRWTGTPRVRVPGRRGLGRVRAVRRRVAPRSAARPGILSIDLHRRGQGAG